jgi:hypothetical protein
MLDSAPRSGRDAASVETSRSVNQVVPRAPSAQHLELIAVFSRGKIAKSRVFEPSSGSSYDLLTVSRHGRPAGFGRMPVVLHNRRVLQCEETGDSRLAEAVGVEM